MKNIKLLLIGFLLCKPSGIDANKKYVVPGVYPHKNALTGCRQSSYPYISGDTFRSLCRFKIDELNEPFDPAAVAYGDIIFLDTDYIDFFFSTVHPHITTPYILISHNSDKSAPGDYIKHLDDKTILGWFSGNPSITDHPKFFPLPSGLSRRCWPHGSIEKMAVAQKSIPLIKKDIFLCANFNKNSSPKNRNHIEMIFQKKPFCTFRPKKPWEGYLVDLARSYFVVSPPGNGLDCHRHWEALLMGAIPIIQHSPLDQLFEDLPVVLIDNWSDITEDFLISKLKEISTQQYDLRKIYAQYWVEMIKNFQKNILENHRRERD